MIGKLHRATVTGLALHKGGQPYRLYVSIEESRKKIHSNGNERMDAIISYYCETKLHTNSIPLF